MASDSLKSAGIAERYAQGLFELAKENNTIEKKKTQAETILEVFRGNPELNVFLNAVKVTKEEKKDFIASVFGQAADIDMIHFLKLLIDKGRVYYLKEILGNFLNLVNESLGIQSAIVWSARPLKQQDLKRIKETLEKKTQKKILLENKINSDLIAGIKVTVGNNVTDVTMKNKIDSMKETLLRGGQA